MKSKIIIPLSVFFFLLAVGSAGAQLPPPNQTLLPGASIPKFVDQLPLGVWDTDPGGTGITVIDATGGVVPPASVPYNIHIAEFKAMILPGNSPTTPAYSGSWVWGYLTDLDVAALATDPVRDSYLGPVVIAQRGVETRPTYSNELPQGLLSNVQKYLPTDLTLDWADPLGTTGPLGCVPNPAGGWTNPECGGIWLGAQPAVPHIHGGEVAPAYDGGPDAWWTSDPLLPVGAGFVSTTFIYPNAQQAGTIWFHDHALGITRLNVYAGMAGVYPIIDRVNEPPYATAQGPGVADPCAGCMPKFPEYDIPLIIQDRSFDTAGNIYYNLASNPQPNIGVHPFWIPEFIGDTIVVNGKTWPFLNVEPRKYRFRLVNGSNARFYDLTLNYTTQVARGGSGKTKAVAATLPFTVIATDDGYLDGLGVNTPNVIIGPGERYEVIVDFAQVPFGSFLTMMNAARTPFPGGAAPVVGTTDTVMQFRVNLTLNKAIAVDVTLPADLRPNDIIQDIKTPAVANKPTPGACPAPGAFPATSTVVRQLTLNEVIGPGGPLELVLNNTKLNPDPVNSVTYTEFQRRDSEQPAVGDTEIWEIINITADAHPIHTHLASFQLLNRQAFQAAAWTNVYAAALAGAGLVDGQGPPNLYLTQNADCAIGGNPAISPYLQAKKLTQPLLYEMGWKDTVITYPGEVTRIVVRWAETDLLAQSTATVPMCNTPCGPGSNPGGTDFECVPGIPVGDLGWNDCVPQAGSNTYPFGPFELLSGVGYVWHCHIIDHEDNEMMRPYIVGPARQPIN